MPRPTRRFAFALVPFLLAGCDSSSETPGSKKRVQIDMADYNMPVSPTVFKDDAPANAKPDPTTLPTQLVDHTGKPVDLTEYRGKKNLVLVITRGVPQSPGGVPCPYCVAQANSLTVNQANFKARDAEVLILFPGPAGQIGDFIEQTAPIKKAIPYPLVLDKDMAVCDRLGVRGDWAKPSTYILDKQGSVVYAYVGETRTDRPSVKAILAQLDKVNGGPPKAAEPPPAPAVPHSPPTAR